MGLDRQVSDRQLPGFWVPVCKPRKVPQALPRLFYWCRPHLKRGFDQRRRSRQRQGFLSLKRTIREFEARIALMPRSGIGAGSVPALRPRRVGTGKQRVGVRRDRVEAPMAAARFEQRRRAGRPLAGTGLTVFPINETSDRMGHASSLGI